MNSPDYNHPATILQSILIRALTVRIVTPSDKETMLATQLAFC